MHTYRYLKLFLYSHVIIKDGFCSDVSQSFEVIENYNASGKWAPFEKLVSRKWLKMTTENLEQQNFC